MLFPLFWVMRWAIGTSQVSNIIKVNRKTSNLRMGGPPACFQYFGEWTWNFEMVNFQNEPSNIQLISYMNLMSSRWLRTPYSASCVASFPTVQPQGWNIFASFTQAWQNSFTKKHEPWILECPPCSDEHHIPQNELKSEEGAKHIFDNDKAKICLAGQYEETSGQSQEPYSMFQIYIQIPSCLPSGDNAVNARRNPALYLISTSLCENVSIIELDVHWNPWSVSDFISCIESINGMSPHCRIWARTSEIWSSFKVKQI